MERDQSEQARFKKQLPLLFPSVVSSGRGVVDFGGSTGGYVAAFSAAAGRRVTVEPALAPECALPGIALDSRNYLAGEPQEVRPPASGAPNDDKTLFDKNLNSAQKIKFLPKNFPPKECYRYIFIPVVHLPVVQLHTVSNT